MAFIALFAIFSIGIAAILWLAGTAVMTDLNVPNCSIARQTKLLLIYPHADDEIFQAGGLAHHMRRRGCEVVSVILTKGERGTPDAHRDDTLKPIRTVEAERSAAALGFSKLIQQDFGDLQLDAKKGRLRKYLDQVIREEQPSLVVTYDLAGWYGHPDHIACSEVVTGLIREQHPSIALWYGCMPKRLFKLIRLPEHMANDPAFKIRRATPKLRLFVGGGLVKKIRAAYQYKSQQSGGVFPMPFVPGWFYYSMILFEYFDVAN